MTIVISLSNTSFGLVTSLNSDIRILLLLLNEEINLSKKDYLCCNCGSWKSSQLEEGTGIQYTLESTLTQGMNPVPNLSFRQYN